MAHRFAYELTDEDKAEYIALVLSGLDLQTAASKLGTTSTQFRKCRSPKSRNYDPDFERAFLEVYTSEQRRRALIEEADTMAWEKARAGDTRMIEKLNLIFNPAWEPLRHQNLNVNIRAEILREALPMLTREQLDAAIESRRDEIKALPPPADSEAA